MKKEFPKKNKNSTKSINNTSTNYLNIFKNMVLGVSIFELIWDEEEKIVDLRVNYINHRSILNKLNRLEKVTDKTINELFEKDIADFYLNMARKAVSTGKSLRCETYFGQFNKYFLINAFSLNKSLIVTLDLDNTQEKETEEELRNTLERLEIEKRQLSAIVENIPVGVIIAEAPSGKFLLANKQIAEIWRYPKTASADEFKKYQGFHPDGRPYKPYEWPLSRSIRTGEIVKDEEIEILRGDGTKGRISVSSVPVHDDGNIIMGIVIDLDITERKKAEDELKKNKGRLESIIQGSPVLTFIIDKDHKVIHWNKAIEEYSGIKAEEIVGTKNHWKALYDEKRQTMADLIIADDFERISELYSGKYRKSTIVEGAYEIEDFFPTMGEKGRWLRATVSVIKDSEGNIIGSMEILEDITERKQAEESLKEARDNLEEQVQERTAELEESREKFRALYDENPSMYFTIDPEFIVLSVNQFGAEQLGYTIHELIGQPLSKIFYEKDIEFAARNLKHAADNYGKVFYWELRKVRKDGSILWVKETSRAIKGSQGNIVIYTACEDITDRKKAEKALKESEEKFRELFNKATDTIVLSEVKENMMPGRFIEVNEAAYNIFGYNENEWENMTPADLFAPEQRDELPQIATELQKKGYATFESVSITKDGRKFPVEVNVHVFRLREKNVAIAMARDISKRKQAENALKESEEKFREIFNNANDMITLSEVKENNEPGRFIEVNEVAHKMLGYSKEELLNMTPFEIVDPDAPVSIPDIASEMSKKRYARHESILIAKDGSKIPVEITTHFFKLREKDVILAVSRDITERKNAEKERESLINELKRSNEELQQFAYVASHDLQEPLRTIASFTQLIERRYKGQLDKDADEFMEFIVDGASRMQAMIKDLLQYSRVETKGEEFKPTNLQNALDNTLSNLKLTIEENSAEITHDKLPMIIGDEKQFIQLFQNLISNAIKFRKKDVPPKIHISVHKDEEKNEYVFSVSDNGIGMEPDQTKHIFEIFQQLHTRDEYKGTGIGLAVAKKIVERHGGRIWVESELGIGTTFYFSISAP